MVACRSGPTGEDGPATGGADLKNWAAALICAIMAASPPLNVRMHVLLVEEAKTGPDGDGDPTWPLVNVITVRVVQCQNLRSDVASKLFGERVITAGQSSIVKHLPQPCCSGISNAEKMNPNSNGISIHWA